MSRDFYDCLCRKYSRQVDKKLNVLLQFAYTLRRAPKVHFVGNEDQVILQSNELKSGSLTRESLNSGDVEQQKSDWTVLDIDQHWLFERNLEVHQIVDFIFSKNQQILAVTGPKLIGIETLVTKSIMFSVERHPNFRFNHAYKV